MQTHGIKLKYAQCVFCEPMSLCSNSLLVYGCTMRGTCNCSDVMLGTDCESQSQASDQPNFG